MRQMLGRFATYVGASPYAAPATLAVVAHVELAGGVWYPQGGIYRIAEAMRQLAEACGVTIHTGSAVARILVDGGRAVGVLLNDGTQQPATAVISNVDVATTYHKLLPPLAAVNRRARRLARTETSCSGFVLMLGIEGLHPPLAHHNIFFADDYRREFDDIFRRGIPPEDPTIYAAITSKSDAGHAPPGCENWFVLVNAPAASARYNWEAHATGYRDHILATLARAGYDLRGRIRSEQMLTPPDLQRMSGAWRGALYGISSNAALNAFRRPNNRCADVRGLYFAGGTTHPGGGVPMVTLSGRVAASMLLRDLR
jgi:phytoene desaturase